MSAPSSGKRLWWLLLAGRTRCAQVVESKCHGDDGSEEMAAAAIAAAGWAVRLFSLALLADTPVFSSEIDAP